MNQEVEIQALNRVRLMVKSIVSLLDHKLDLKEVPGRTLSMREQGRSMLLFDWAEQGVCVAPKPLFSEKVYYKLFAMRASVSSSVPKYHLRIYKSGVEFFRNYVDTDGVTCREDLSLDVGPEASLGDAYIFERLNAYNFTEGLIRRSLVRDVAVDGEGEAKVLLREYTGWLSKGQIKLFYSLLLSGGLLSSRSFASPFYFNGIYFSGVYPNGARSFKKVVPFVKVEVSQVDTASAGHDLISIEGLLASLMDSYSVECVDNDRSFKVLLSHRDLEYLETLHRESKSSVIPLDQMVWRSRGFRCYVVKGLHDDRFYMVFKQ